MVTIEEKSGWKKKEMVRYKERVKTNFQKECGKLINVIEEKAKTEVNNEISEEG